MLARECARACVWLGGWILHIFPPQSQRGGVRSYYHGNLGVGWGQRAGWRQGLLSYLFEDENAARKLAFLVHGIVNFEQVTISTRGLCVCARVCGCVCACVRVCARVNQMRALSH